ncbi:DUF2790 domain-containing protein [Pseudomonas cavernicola]|uniref:DUF2790 domain-containing protein n=1 Tax=Pseudomonas cavernicola TaxID=2320866 RepID=A0A418XP80_9PSED|nr:DUF2790 domain-containing protein [Pseudomonas cavernicola]RJG14303.1 DUF2790 domain-containing protein [Pseudomonas cavernicola]
MKTILTGLALASLCPLALATSMDASHELPVEVYNYSMELDIAKVIAIDTPPYVCEVVPTRMTYEDSKGQRHILEYLVWGGGCSGD